MNLAAPGFIEDTGFFGGKAPEDRRVMWIAETSNGRAGTPEDVAETLHWLASPAAGHITPQVIQVNDAFEGHGRCPPSEKGYAHRWISPAVTEIRPPPLLRRAMPTDRKERIS